MSKRRRVVGIAAAVALALIGTFVLIAYVRNAGDRAAAGEELAPVYVAAERIPAGTKDSELASKVKREQVPVRVRAEGAVSNLDQVDGLVTSIALLPGEQLATTRFSKPGATDAQTSVTGTKIPLGWFQTTILLEPAQALGGTVKANQHVAVVASLDQPDATGQKTTVAARDVIVTNVQIDGDQGASADKKQVTSAPTGNFLVTVAVPQDDLERIVNATSQGKVWLATEPSAG